MDLSLIIPIYNAEEFLPRLFENLEAQGVFFDDKEIGEVIFVNDGSSDNSEALILEYGKMHPWVKYFKQKNQGPHIARNVGIYNSKGKYIVFGDSDDAYTANAFHLFWEVAEKYDADIVRGGFNLCEEKKFKEWQSYDNGRVEKSIEESGLEFIIRNRGLHFIGNVWGCIYKRSFIIENNLYFDERIRFYEDYAYNWMILVVAKKVVSISNVVYLWIQRSGSMTHTYNISHRVKNEVNSSLQSAIFMREMWRKYSNRIDFPVEITRMILRGSYWSCFKYFGSLIKYRCISRKGIAPVIKQLKGLNVYPYPHSFPKDLPDGYPTSLPYRIMWRAMSYEWLLKLMLRFRCRKNQILD